MLAKKKNNNASQNCANSNQLMHISNSQATSGYAGLSHALVLNWPWNYSFIMQHS